LDRLAVRPNASVIVCEGEKAADAAAAIFPKSVAVTSSNGAASASKTDWSPFAGKRVLIWPDADPSGSKYAREVAGILSLLGCDVSITDATALASIAPGGGGREPTLGWDAANAATGWPASGLLRKAAHDVAILFDPGPRYVSYGLFEMSAAGLTTGIPSKGENKGERFPFYISAAFEVLGLARSIRAAVLNDRLLS
jgi:putative DNA primase/helicase